jgi:flagellar biosynthesis anti-sigma factor FlgM
MTIDIVGLGSQTRIDSNEPHLDRVSSGTTSSAHGAENAIQNDEIATLSRTSTVKTLVDEAIRDSDVRTEKIEQLRLAIHSGQYNISAHDVANAMLTESE